MEIAAKVVINAAGLGPQALARSIDAMPSVKIPPLYLAKGNYFALTKPSPFTRLIYPIPTPGGLGIHLTFDLAGQVRNGPDAERVDEVNYGVDPDPLTVSTRPLGPTGPTYPTTRCSRRLPALDQRLRVRVGLKLTICSNPENTRASPA